MHTIYIAIGANVGKLQQHIKQAKKLLASKIIIIKEAPLYETKPWGFTKQHNFLNTALEATTDLTPEELLAFIKSVEKKIGRIHRFINGPREIDIDILFYDNLVLKSPFLIIPHPKIEERDFVLQPLRDIAPNLSHPILQKTIKELLENIPQNQRVVVKKLQ